MPRIGATLSGHEQLFLTQLSRSDNAALESALRLTSGRNFYAPSDNPSAFLQVSRFEQRLNVVKGVQVQVEAATLVGSGMQLGLDEARTQLEAIRESLLLDASGELTDSERELEQVGIDAALAAITETSNTEINGRRFLDGSVNYRFSGKDSDQIKDIQVHALRETEFSGTVTSAATQASITYTGSGGNATADATFTLTGKRGASTFTVSNGSSLTEVADLINETSYATGITAEVNGDDLDFTSVDYGDEATIDVDVTSGTFATSGTSAGADAVVTINGKSIGSVAIDGNRVRYASNGTHVAFEFQEGFSGAFGTVSVLDDDVAKFTLSPEIDDLTSVGFSGISTELLGGVSGRLSQLQSGGSLSGLGGNTAQAIRVVDEALAELTLLEGSVNAFADVAVESSASLLSGLVTNLEETIHSVGAVNEEQESILLSKNQSLGSNAVTSISVLQQQQATMLALVRAAAGF